MACISDNSSSSNNGGVQYVYNFYFFSNSLAGGTGAYCIGEIPSLDFKNMLFSFTMFSSAL